jgi:DNA-binding NarL/FixJ family response regulator
MTKITLLLSAPHDQFFHSVKLHLRQQNDIDIVGHAPDELQTMRSVLALQPAVLLFASESPNMGGMSVLTKIRHFSPATNTALFCHHSTDDFITRAIEHGAKGCLPMGSLEHSVRAVRAIHSGEYWLGRQILGHVLAKLLRPVYQAHESQGGLRDDLSDREREIVFLMRQGMSNKEIASALHISDMTVKTHAHNIFRKLKVSGRLRLFREIERRNEAVGDRQRAVRNPNAKSLVRESLAVKFATVPITVV